MMAAPAVGFVGEDGFGRFRDGRGLFPGDDDDAVGVADDDVAGQNGDAAEGDRGRPAGGARSCTGPPA